MLYKLKSVARRGTLFGAAAALAVSAFAPLAPAAYADALNPLTERSLTLSSSAPGWDYFDGSNNTTYAQPNSGANGQKTGNTFDFKVSTTSSSANPLKAMSFQYCTTSAGECLAPGDNDKQQVAPRSDTTTTSDLNVNFPSPDELDSADFGDVVDTDGTVKAVPGFTDPAINSTASTTGQYAAHDVAGNYVVYYDNGGTWTQSTGWNMAVSNVEDYATEPTEETGQNNFITLWNTTGLEIPAGTQMKVIFFGTDDNYITNPGSGAFFVKINTYSDFTDGTAYDAGPPEVSAVAPTLDEADILDGGVTVANVMNHSIKIQTKVLETMRFSVGTVDPNTLDSTDGVGSEFHAATGEEFHGACDPIVGSMNSTDPVVNVLKLGDQSAESSLSAEETYATHSYWRLSSNSSAGATVYYSGVTLSNTVGDKISAIGSSPVAPSKGNEQFGLALMNGNAGNDYAVDYSQIPTYENADDQGKTAVHATVASDHTANNIGGYHDPQLFPLAPEAAYANGGGDFTTGSTTQFAFDETSNSVPVALASQDNQVVDCVTAKVRYIANIASTTPAGIYTTAVNYIAAPQY